MKIFGHIKKYGGIVVGAGVGLVVDSLLKGNIPAPRSFWKRTLMKVGIFAIGTYAAKKVTESFEEDVDILEKETKELVKEIDKIKEDSKVEA